MSELLELATDLYARPLEEFTAARDACARELKGTPLAAEVKRLRKPSTAAWVVDLLVRFETEQVEQMLAVGAALRAAQEGLDAAQLRELTKQRRQLTAAVTTRARALARERGLRVSESVAEQVEATLTAAMVDEGAARALRSGLLATPMVATGFDPVDAAAAVALPEALGFEAPAASRELHAVAAPDTRADDAAEAAREAAEAAVAQARAALEAAQDEERDAADRLEQERARALELESRIDELRRRLADAETEAEDQAEEVAEAERDHAEAAEAVAAAERRLAEASDALGGG